ncbi:MAG: hypothetical protein J5574_06695 [Lachnospiraceae bacterium]|nr:hypothetical protein [Lachnospiraceae bacterium]
MKKKQKCFAFLTVFVTLAGMLAGCGKGDPDPNSGLYEAVSATMMGMEIDVSDIYENGVSFDLQDGSKCIANMDGDKAKIKWSTDGDSIHLEGGGVELDGTIGGGDMTLVNMMDMGMDMKFHCDELLHANLENEDGKSSDKDSKSSGSVLARLKDAKAGKDVYSNGASSEAGSVEKANESDGQDTVKNEDGEDTSGLVNEDGSLDGSMLLNPDYESVSGKKFESGTITVAVPDGWEAFDVSNDHVRVIKGGSSPDDYMSNASIQIEWHDNSSGSIDSSNMDEPVKFSGLKLGQHNYNGVYGTVPGDWASYMMIDEQGDGYILVTLSIPSDSDVYILDSDVQAIMASVEVK